LKCLSPSPSKERGEEVLKGFRLFKLTWLNELNFEIGNRFPVITYRDTVVNPLYSSI
jgi:hypothetical protein